MSALLRHRLTVLFAVLAAAGGLCLAVAPVARADGGSLRSWTGSGDGHSWSDGANWDTGVPQDGDSVVIEPQAGGCATHVDEVPTITLQDFTMGLGSGCGTSITGGAITVDQSFSWDEGNLATPVTLAAGSTGTITGNGTSSGKSLAAGLTVQGTLDLADVSGQGALMITDPNVLHVTGSGALHTSGTVQVTYLACCVTPARITNNGVISVDDGSFSVDQVALDQLGTMTVASGATATLTGPGLLGPGSYSGAGRFVLGASSTAQLAGKSTLGAGFHLELAGGSLAGSGSIAGSGSMDWTGGVLAATATVKHGGTLHTYGAVTHSLPGSLTDDGTVTVDGQATVLMSGGNTLTVASDGVLNAAPGTSFTTTSCCTSPNRIVNSGGTVIVPAASGEVSPGTPASIDGNSYQALGGTTSVAPGEALALTGGARGELAATTVSGGGTLQVATPVTLTHTTTVGAATRLALMPAGSLDGTGTVSGTGELDWTGGTFSGSPTVASKLDVSGPASKSIAQNGVLHVTGSMDIESGTAETPDLIGMSYYPATLYTSGTTTVGHDVLVHGGLWHNDGTLVVDASGGGAATVDQNGRLVNTGTARIIGGTMSVTGGYQQSSGSSEVNSGATLAAPSGSTPVVVTGGTLAGSGTIDGSVQDTGGTVAPGPLDGAPGTLTVTGSYLQAPGGRLAVDLAGTAPSKHDLLAVTGSVNLAGVLTATSQNGYAPSKSTTITTVTGSSRTGAFQCAFSVDLPKRRWQPAYTGTSVTVSPRAAGASGCLAYQPIAPVRAPGNVTVSAGAAATVDLRGVAGITGATPAATVNIVASGATAEGTLTVSAHGATSTATTLRFRPGASTAGQVTVALGSGKLTLQTSNGSVHVHVDVLGLFADGQDGSGALVHPLQPADLHPVTVAAASDVDVPVAGKSGIPAGATAVTATVTVRSATADASLAVLPGGAAYAGTESVPVTQGQDTSNLVTTALDGSGRLRLHLSAGTAVVTVTVLAWYGIDGTGSWTVPLVGATVNTSTVTATGSNVPLVGVGGVPSTGATSVLVSADVSAATKPATLKLGGRSAALWSAVQVPSSGGAAAPAEVVPGVFNQATEKITKGSATVALAIFGYTVG